MCREQREQQCREHPSRLFVGASGGTSPALAETWARAGSFSPPTSLRTTKRVSYRCEIQAQAHGALTGGLGGHLRDRSCRGVPELRPAASDEHRRPRLPLVALVEEEVEVGVAPAAVQVLHRRARPIERHVRLGRGVQHARRSARRDGSRKDEAEIRAAPCGLEERPSRRRARGSRPRTITRPPALANARRRSSAAREIARRPRQEHRRVALAAQVPERAALEPQQRRQAPARPRSRSRAAAPAAAARCAERARVRLLVAQPQAAGRVVESDPAPSGRPCDSRYEARLHVGGDGGELRLASQP